MCKLLQISICDQARLSKRQILCLRTNMGFRKNLEVIFRIVDEASFTDEVNIVS